MLDKSTVIKTNESKGKFGRSISSTGKVVKYSMDTHKEIDRQEHKNSERCCVF